MGKQDMFKKLTSINSLCSLLEFKGQGIIGFLNNLVISDVSSFKTNQIYYTALCNPKGRIVASFFIYINNAEHIVIFCPKNMDSELTQFFNMRKFRLKFSLSLQTNRQINVEVANSNDFIGILTTSTINEFYRALFDCNLPWIDKANTEKFIPQHVNLDQHENIMSFTKGCYPGQEIIARLKYLGKIKKRMKLVSADKKSELQQNHQLISVIIEDQSSRFCAQVVTD